MGTATSRAEVTIDTTQLNSTVFNFLKDMKVTSKSDILSTQTINATNIKAYGCILNIENKADISVTQIQQFTEESATQLKQSITTQLQNQANVASEATSELGSQGSDSTTIVRTKTLISDSVEQSITLKTLNEMVTIVNSNQTSNTSDIVFDPCGFTMFTSVGMAPPAYVYDKCNVTLPCNIDNNVSIHAMTTQIVNSVTSALMEKEALSNIVNSVTASSSAKSTGLASIVSSLFDGIAGVFGSILGGIGGIFSGPGFIIIIIILAAAAYFFLKSGGAEKLAAMTPQGKALAAAGAVSGGANGNAPVSKVNAN